MIRARVTDERQKCSLNVWVTLADSILSGMLHRNPADLAGNGQEMAFQAGCAERFRIPEL